MRGSQIARSSWPATVRHLLWYTPPPLHPELAPRLRAEQIKAYVRFALPLCLAVLVSSCTVMAVLWQSQNFPQAVFAFAALVGVTVWRMSTYVQWRSQADPLTLTARPLRQESLYVLLIAFFWAAAAGFLVIDASQSDHVFLLFVSAGVAAAGSIALAPLPGAAFAFILVVPAPAFFCYGYQIAEAPNVIFLLFIFFLVSYVFFARLRYAELVEAVRLNHELERSQDRLTQLVADRTRDVHVTNQKLAAEISEKKAVEIDLLEARGTAQAAAYVKSAFLAQMNHELRTPLTAIIGFSQILDRQIFGPLENELYRDYVRDIHDSALRLLAFIDDLFELRQINAGPSVRGLDANDIKELVDHALEQHEADFTTKKCRTEIHIDTDLPVIAADPTAVGAILSHLILNAVRLAQKGAIIYIVAAASDDGVVLSVTDNKATMALPREKMKTATTDITGRGSMNAMHPPFHSDAMGLVAVKLLVELHGGEIDIHRPLPIGSAVSVLLPFTAHHQQETPVAQNAVA